MLANEDLRNGAPARLLCEANACLVVVGDVDLLVRDALLLEKALGANAVRAPRGREDFHGLHRLNLMPDASGGSEESERTRLSPIDDYAGARDPACPAAA